jgi:hypothetical protein
MHDVFLVPSQMPTIQQALDAVVRPSTIVLSPGVYAEDLRIVAKENVVIQSAQFGRRGVTLTGRSAATVIEIERSAVYLSGIEIRSDQRARGIVALEASIALQECVIAGNRAADAGAGMLCRASSVRVQKSTLATNSVHAATNGAGGGLHLVDCKTEIAGSSIQTNAVYASSAAMGGGVWCEGGRLRVWRSRVTDNVLYAPDCAGGGIYFSDCDGAQLGGSVITGNGSADGRGGGIFIRGDAERVIVHGDTIVRRNHPDDRA